MDLSKSLASSTNRDWNIIFFKQQHFAIVTITKLVRTSGRTHGWERYQHYCSHLPCLVHLAWSHLAHLLLHLAWSPSRFQNWKRLDETGVWGGGHRKCPKFSYTCVGMATQLSSLPKHKKYSIDFPWFSDTMLIIFGWTWNQTPKLGLVEVGPRNTVGFRGRPASVHSETEAEGQSKNGRKKLPTENKQCILSEKVGIKRPKGSKMYSFAIITSVTWSP